MRLIAVTVTVYMTNRPNLTYLSTLTCSILANLTYPFPFLPSLPFPNNSEFEFACCSMCDKARYQSPEEEALAAAVDAANDAVNDDAFVLQDHLLQQQLQQQQLQQHQQHQQNSEFNLHDADIPDYPGRGDYYDVGDPTIDVPPELLRGADVPRPEGWPVEDVTEEENHLLRKVVSVLLEYPGYYLKITDFGSGNNPRLKQLGIEMRDKNPDTKSKKKLTGFLQRYPELFVCYDLLCGPKVISIHLSIYLYII